MIDSFIAVISFQFQTKVSRRECYIKRKEKVKVRKLLG